MATPQLIAAQPIAQPRGEGALAPWPYSDRQPIVVGPGLSLAYVSAIFRLSLQGYRQQYVDLLEELLEKDPGTYAVLSKRVLGVSGGRIALTPPACEPGSLDEVLAKEIATRCTEMLAGIPDLTQHLAALSWAVYYAIGGVETHWRRDGATGYVPSRLSFIHSRRLSYPVPSSWDLHVWDNGAAYSWEGDTRGKQAFFGIRVADNPGKFIIHAPQIRGTYPTREGLGRQIAYWMVLKLIATRGAPQYLERFARPWPEAVYSTGTKTENRVATKEDIADAKDAMRAMGAGALAHWVHPDTIELDLKTAHSGGGTNNITYAEWIGICNSEIAKATLGGTLSTDVGTTGGNRALGETQRKSELALLGNDAKLLAASIKRDLVSWMVSLNWPDAPRHLIPDVAIHIEEDPDPMAVIDRAAKGAAAGMPVDASAVAKQAGIPLIAPGDQTAIRMVPIQAQKDPALFDADFAARMAAVAAQYAVKTPEASTNESQPNEQAAPEQGEPDTTTAGDNAP